jgi:alpha-galactosidase
MHEIDVPLPDAAHVIAGDGAPRPTVPSGTARWTASGVEVTARQEPGGALRLGIAAPGGQGVSKVALRWRHHPGGRAPALVLGDAWERSYGELQWRGIQPERPLPWYWLGTDPASGTTAGLGVRTRAGALCCWTVDEDGTTLWLDVRSGGRPVLPGERELAAATVVGVAADGSRPYEVLQSLCAAMSPDPLLPGQPVVGCNNWYYAYGRDFGPDAVLRDAATIAEYAGDHPVRPFCVVDDGWTEGGGSAPGGPWDTGLPGVFDDMAGLAAGIAERGARPGLWFRPLLSRTGTKGMRTDTGAPGRIPLDPSRDDTLTRVAEDIARFRAWGYELIKHDFSTYDVFGRFHPDTPPEMAGADWQLADRTRTTAEVLVAFYRTIAEAAGDALVIGCNTVGHLAAGLVAVQRTGDDTSGRHWERTRRMGINTLAFRLAQQGRFYAVDADCVPCTPATDWALNRQFLDLVARSGTALFVSVDPAARTPGTDADLTAAVRIALNGGQPGGVEPLDWLGTTAPRHWRSGDTDLTYTWSQPWGAWPLLPS